MDKKQGIPKSKGLPIIGDKEKEGRAMVQYLMEAMAPTFEGITLAIDEIQRRLSVVEEVKKLFPDRVEVIIKKEKS